MQSFYKDIEIPLKNALQITLDRLIDAAHRSRPEEQPRTVGIGREGEPIITSAAQTLPVLGPNVQLAWEIESIDSTTLDLEKLRNFFTEAELRNACRRRLREYGPEQITGVVYREVAKRI